MNPGLSMPASGRRDPRLAARAMVSRASGCLMCWRTLHRRRLQMLDQRALAWGQPVRLAGGLLHEAGAAGRSFEGVRHSSGSVRAPEDTGIGGFGWRQRDAWVEDCRGATVALPDASCIARTPMCMRRTLHPFAPHGRSICRCPAGERRRNGRVMKLSRTPLTCLAARRGLSVAKEPRLC